MNKKQILSTILAGLITLNTLGGCSSNKVYSDSLDYVSNIEERLYDNYKITTIDIPVLKNEIPEGYILIGDKAYKVEKLVIDQHVHPAIKTINKYGIISYSAPFSGILSGDKYYIETSHYELVASKNEAIDVIYHSLLENIELILQK